MAEHIFGIEVPEGETSSPEMETELSNGKGDDDE